MPVTMKEKYSKECREKFAALCKKPIEDQRDFFINRYVFSLSPAEIGEVYKLAIQFKEKVALEPGFTTDIGFVGAADMLMKTGKPRTAQQRKEELADVDVDSNGRTSLLEFFLLHYKIHMLKEFFAREGIPADVDMDGEGVGLSGVGERLIGELFAPPLGLDPDLEKMMKEFSIQTADTEKKIAEQLTVINAGGIKAMAAKTEMGKLTSANESGLHHIEAKIKASFARAEKAAAVKLAEYHANNKSADAAKDADAKAKLAARAAS
jgi:hypothetical protein